MPWPARLLVAAWAFSSLATTARASGALDCAAQAEGARRLHLAGRHAEAALQARSTRQRCGASTGLGLLRVEAEAAAWSGRLRQADEPLGLILERAPDEAWAHALAGRVAGWRGRWREAETALRRSLELDPHHAPARLGLAEVLAWTGRLSESRTMLESLDDRERERPEARAIGDWLEEARSTWLTLDLQRIDDSRPARFDEWRLLVDVPLSSRRPLRLEVEATRLALDEGTRPTDRDPPLPGAPLRDRDGWRLQAGVLAELGGRWRLRAGLGTVDLEADRVGTWEVDAAWRAHGPSRTWLRLSCRRLAEDFTALGAERSIARVESSLTIDASPWRAELHAEATHVALSDDNDGRLFVAWWLIDVVRRERVSFALGHAVTVQSVNEQRYELRGFASEPLPGGGFAYDLDGEFAYWTPADHRRHELIARLRLEGRSRWRLELSGSRAMDDRTTLPYLFPELGPSPEPDIEALEVGESETRNERPFAARARLGLDLSSELSLELGWDRVSRIFYDYDAWSLRLTRRFGRDS